MADHIQIRTAVPGDITRILAILKAALGETKLLKRTPDLFRWKHAINPFGESIVLVGEIAGDLVGVRAMMRWDLLTPSGHLVKCLRPVDTATDPRFARRGIFKSLTLNALDIARDIGIDLVFNTPNPQSAPGYLGMGWREVGWIGAMLRPRLGRATDPSADLPRLGVVVPSAVEFQPIAGANRQPLGLRTDRGLQYQQWRFNEHPTARYGWVGEGDGGGVVVRAGIRRNRTETVITDFLGKPSSRAIARTRRGNRSRYLAGWFSPGTPERRTALRAGLIPVPGLKALRLVALPLSEIDLDVLDLGSWDFATSDLELL